MKEEKEVENWNIENSKFKYKNVLYIKICLNFGNEKSFCNKKLK
jgi:hypothetical protein